ncbi:MAG TPA: hypothetical protein VIM11_10710 [Tepidisphaeraceae bacterium]
MVTRTGGTSVSRAGKSILTAAGLGEFATESVEQFVDVASALATDVPRLSRLRATPARTSPRFGAA